MTSEPESKQFRHFLRATPNGKYYILYVDPEDPAAGSRISLNMTETEVHELCHKQWPSKYSDAEIDERLRTARERTDVCLGQAPPGRSLGTQEAQ